MKRCLSLLLALILTALCGCGAEPAVTTEPAESAMATIPTTPDGNLVAPTRPEDVELNYTDAALAVKITINPELELALDYAYMVVSATALNADAETLLEGMELEGKPYADAVSTILEKAKEQNFLQSGKKVTVTAREIEEDGWTEAAETMLTKPLVDYQYEFYPAGKVSDPKNAARVERYEIAGEDHVMYFLGDFKVKEEITCPDGTYVVLHFMSKDEHIELDYRPDGVYEYHHITASEEVVHIVYPDGSRDSWINKKDEFGRTIWSYGEDVNGYTSERFTYYEGDRMVRATSIEANGTQTEEIYHPNGTVALCVGQRDGEKWEQYYDEQGVIQQDRYFGTDGYYYETYFDENGVTTSSYSKEPDGTEYRTVYENGQPKHTTMTRPDGTTETYDE